MDKITLYIDVTGRVAKHRDRDKYIVWDNEDYQIEFSFDDTWDQYPVKTARFIWHGNRWETEFSGNVCPVPVVRDANYVLVGIYVDGKFCTTTSAEILCSPSCLNTKGVASSGSGEPHLSEARAAANEAKQARDETAKILDNAISSVTPSIGENGNWFIGNQDTGVAAVGRDGNDGIIPHIGSNMNWFIGDQDTGVAANGRDGADGKNGTDGRDGITPHIGANGHWFVGEHDTGVVGEGRNGADGQDGITPHIGKNGHWFIGNTDTEIVAIGRDGVNGATPYVGANNNWFVNGVDTGILARGTNGKDGQDGKDGKNGIDGTTPHIGANGNWFVGNTDTGVLARGSDGQDGTNGQDGQDGKDAVTPLLLINEQTNEWEVSYDGGMTWNSLGIKATGKDGINGTDGRDGVDGRDGNPGYTPVRGVDFWTPDDIAAIEAYIDAKIDEGSGGSSGDGDSETIDWSTWVEFPVDVHEISYERSSTINNIPEGTYRVCTGIPLPDGTPTGEATSEWVCVNETSIQSLYFSGGMESATVRRTYESGTNQVVFEFNFPAECLYLLKVEVIPLDWVRYEVDETSRKSRIYDLTEGTYQIATGESESDLIKADFAWFYEGGKSQDNRLSFGNGVETGRVVNQYTETPRRLPDGSIIKRDDFYTSSFDVMSSYREHAAKDGDYSQAGWHNAYILGADATNKVKNGAKGIIFRIDTLDTTCISSVLGMSFAVQVYFGTPSGDGKYPYSTYMVATPKLAAAYSEAKYETGMSSTWYYSKDGWNWNSLESGTNSHVSLPLGKGIAFVYIPIESFWVKSGISYLRTGQHAHAGGGELESVVAWNDAVEYFGTDWMFVMSNFYFSGSANNITLAQDAATKISEWSVISQGEPADEIAPEVLADYVDFTFDHEVPALYLAKVSEEDVTDEYDELANLEWSYYDFTEGDYRIFSVIPSGNYRVAISLSGGEKYLSETVWTYDSSSEGIYELTFDKGGRLSINHVIIMGPGDTVDAEFLEFDSSYLIERIYLTKIG